MQLPTRAHLDEQVTQRRRLDGAGNDRPLAGVSRELVKNPALGAAADNVNDLDTVAGEFLQPAEHFAILEREALVGASDQLAFGLRHGLPGFAAEVLNGLRHVGRIEEARVIGVNDGPERWSLGGHLRELAVFVFATAGIEGAFALLHQPQAHDVLEQAIGAVQPAFVGQVQLLRAGG